MIDESGLSFVQMKALIALETPARTRSHGHRPLRGARRLGASASRAADGLVRKRSPRGSRTRRPPRAPAGLTAKGDELADRIISARLAGLEEFAATLKTERPRQLEAALDLLLERPEIAEIYETYERKARR